MNRTRKTELYLNYESSPEIDKITIYSDDLNAVENAARHIAINNNDIEMIGVYIDGIATARLFKFYDGTIKMY